ncbi:MAG TPA: phage head closure protein [Vicinamibacterales bacterium]|nr:phage head closure protein [Vicinamibacterales bacterium]
MRAGRLRQRVEIQQRIETRDEMGGVSEAWETVAMRWASIEPLQGRELMEAQQIASRVTMQVRMRYYEGLSPKHRLIWRAGDGGVRKTLGIEAVISRDERDRDHELLCTRTDD